MNIEYAAVRLRAMKMRFVPNDGIASIASGLDIISAASLLEDSIFQSGISALRLKGGRKITVPSLVRAVNDGYLHALSEVFKMLRLVLPELAEAVFSRFELEQVKQAIRSISVHENVSERRLRFVNLLLRPTPAWAGQWRTYKDAKKFKRALKDTAHPFATALKLGEEAADNARTEMELERFYFMEYLPARKNLLKDAWDYFADQCDLVNVQTASLLRGSGVSGTELKSLHVPGPGKIPFGVFASLYASNDDEFAKSVQRLFGFETDAALAASPSKVSTSVIRHNLGRYRRRVRVNPLGIWEIFLFLEELKAMASNLRLALLFSVSRVSGDEATEYFIN